MENERFLNHQRRARAIKWPLMFCWSRAKRSTAEVYWTLDYDRGRRSIHRTSIIKDQLLIYRTANGRVQRSAFPLVFKWSWRLFAELPVNNLVRQGRKRLGNLCYKIKMKVCLIGGLCLRPPFITIYYKWLKHSIIDTNSNFPLSGPSNQDGSGNPV